jgi:hypothetical protein
VGDVATTEGADASVEIVTVDSTAPVVDVASAERLDIDTAPANAPANQVQRSRGVTLWGTVSDSLSGIQVVWADLDGDGNRDAGEDMTHVGSTGDWFITVANVGTSLVTKTVNLYAIDNAGNQSAALAASYTVVADGVAPSVSPSVTYAKGAEALRSENVTVSAAISDDVAGISLTAGEVKIVDASGVTGNASPDAVNLAQSSTTTTTDPIVGDTTVTVASVSGFSVGNYLRFGVTADRAQITAINANTSVITFNKPLTVDPGPAGTTVWNASSNWTAIIAVGSAIDYGTKTLTVSAEDNAGNTAQATIEVIVSSARTHWKVSLAEGWNFFSLPRDPVDTSLAAVLADTTVTEIHTASGGVWSGAKLVDGAWVGTLTELRGGVGYVALASAAGTLTETFEELPPLAAPPAFEIAQGWNIVGFYSMPLDTEMDVHLYVYSLSGDWSIVYDPANWSWARPGATPGAAAVASAGFFVSGTSGNPALQASKAYWLFAREAGTLAM